MPVQMSEENDGKVLVVTVNGNLTAEDYEEFVREFERLVGQHGKMRVLLEMTYFRGWELGVLWKDTKFAFTHHEDIDKLAVVGDKRCQRGMEKFCKPFLKATTRFFEQTAADKARKWLAEE